MPDAALLDAVELTKEALPRDLDIYTKLVCLEAEGRGGGVYLLSSLAGLVVASTSSPTFRTHPPPNPPPARHGQGEGGIIMGTNTPGGSRKAGWPGANVLSSLRDLGDGACGGAETVWCHAHHRRSILNTTAISLGGFLGA